MAASNRNAREAGQAAVETALVMPLFMFLILGIIQLSLMHQARLMTKYAAFKAARAGSLQRSNKDMMKKAALAVLLPFAADPMSGTKVLTTSTASDYLMAWTFASANRQGSASIVDVTICNPIQGHFTRPANLTDVDCPQCVAPSNRDDWRVWDRTRLTAQVTFNFPLVIPFANAVLWQVMRGQENAVLMQLIRTNQSRTVSTPYSRFSGMAAMGRYLGIIRQHWSVRMHSPPLPNVIPARNDCFIPFAKLGGGGPRRRTFDFRRTN